MSPTDFFSLTNITLTDHFEREPPPPPPPLTRLSARSQLGTPVTYRLHVVVCALCRLPRIVIDPVAILLEHDVLATRSDRRIADRLQVEVAVPERRHLLRLVFRRECHVLDMADREAALSLAGPLFGRRPAPLDPVHVELELDERLFEDWQRVRAQNTVEAGAHLNAGVSHAAQRGQRRQDSADGLTPDETVILLPPPLHHY